MQQSLSRRSSMQQPQAETIQAQTPIIEGQYSRTSHTLENPHGENQGTHLVIELLKQEEPRFKQVLSQINFDGIQLKAREVRHAYRCRQERTSEGPEAAATSLPIECQVVFPPLSGSYNLAFRIVFRDGVEWLMKIPANGYVGAWDSLSASALKSEALTMRYIKGRSQIPVPRVYCYNNGFDSPVKCPFILMEFVRGRPLYQVWFDDTAGNCKQETIRARALQTTALAMAQLSQFTFDRCGSLRFGADNEPVIDAARIVDVLAMLDRSKQKKNPNGHEDDDGDIFCSKGPLVDPMAALFFMLDREKPAKMSNRNKGARKLLRLFAEWAYDHIGLKDLGDQQFSLAHPDLDLQNLLVKDDGTLCAIIDWDGVAAVPQSVGSLCYPKWLMRDWEPTHYGRADRDENEPDELATYRVDYAQFLEMALSMLPSSRWRSKELAQITRASIVIGTLETAASNPELIPGIMGHIFDQMEVFESPDDVESSESSRGEEEDDHNDDNDDTNRSTPTTSEKEDVDYHKIHHGDIFDTTGTDVKHGNQGKHIEGRVNLANAPAEIGSPGPAQNNDGLGGRPSDRSLTSVVCEWLKKKFRRLTRAFCHDGPRNPNAQLKPEVSLTQSGWSKKIMRAVEWIRGVIRMGFVGKASCRGPLPDLEAQKIESVEDGNHLGVDTEVRADASGRIVEHTNALSQDCAQTTGKFYRGDVWDRIDLETKNCGITTTMLKDGQREIAIWIIDHLKEKEKEKHGKTMDTGRANSKPGGHHKPANVDRVKVNPSKQAADAEGNRKQNAQQARVEDLDQGCVDKGGFTASEVCFALGKGKLDDVRSTRLHKSFSNLLNWTMGSS
ncbi:hypothetical protein ACLMJK_001137 [Lecanora helva]